MKIITSREFNQNLGKAQKAALTAPVIITNRGEPAFVLMTYKNYAQRYQPKTFRSIGEALADPNPEAADVELELQPRSRGQRRPVEF